MTKVHRLPLHPEPGASAPEPTEDEMLQVGELARACGKTVRAIHHYENLGLLMPSKRSKGRYRLYAPDAVHRVNWISKLNDLGMSLTEIQEILSRWEEGPSAPEAMSRIQAVYQDKLAEVRRQIQHLEGLEHELQASIRYLSTCETTCDPAELIKTCSCCRVHDPQQDEPELVAGLYAGTPINEVLSAE